MFLQPRNAKGKGSYWGNGGIAPRTLGLGTRLRWVVSFTPRPLYPQGKRPCYLSVGSRAGLDVIFTSIIH